MKVVLLDLKKSLDDKLNYPFDTHERLELIKILANHLGEHLWHDDLEEDRDEAELIVYRQASLTHWDSRII